jgi:hypothetical protein
MSIYAAATARAEDGLSKIEAIADAFITDRGCEMDVVEKVEAMGHMIQRLRQELPDQRTAMAAWDQYKFGGKS